MTTTRVRLLDIEGDVVAVRCTEDEADQGEYDGLWTVVGSARIVTLAQAKREAKELLK